jgi:signal transduction histidine kinase
MSTSIESVELTAEACDKLHPFSCITDQVGAILHVGAALQKLCRARRLLGQYFHEQFSIEQPILGLPGRRPAQLCGEMLIVVLNSQENVRLRGQVVQISTNPALYLFSLQPAITNPEELSSLGIDFSDFEIGAPIFDFLLLIRAQQIGQSRLEAANQRLELDVRMSRLLQRVTSAAYSTEDSQILYSGLIEAVCVDLDWDIGHLFLVEAGAPSLTLTSTDIWYLSHPERYEQFVRATSRGEWRGEFPASICARREVEWLSDYQRIGERSRAQALPLGSQFTAVAVPVVSAVSADRVVAVLEFLSEKPQTFSETARSFFSLLGTQLGAAQMHHETIRREREQLAALAQASKMATLGEIAAGVAHEINNPISTISLISQILKRAIGEGGIAQEIIIAQIPKIEECVERVAKIVAELRDFSRESSRDPYQLVPLSKIVSDSVNLCHARFLAKGIKLYLPQIPPEWLLECRASQISQIILNLLSNAHDAVAGRDDPWVRVECLEKNDHLEIAVCDSGPGVPAEIRERIMSPFFTTKPQGQGTGLGLSISSNIATDHAGSLTLDTNASCTRFVLILPKRQQR